MLLSIRSKLCNLETKKQRDLHYVLSMILFSNFIILMLEILSRHSIIKGLGFIITNPLMFNINVLIVLLTLSISMLFSRRRFMLFLFSAIWIGLGVVNYTILCHRLTPLTSMDFYIIKAVIIAIPVYLNPFQIIFISVIVVIIIVTLILLYRRLKKNQILIKLPLLLICILLALMLTLSTTASKVNALSNKFGNLPDAFSDYGFAYCFVNSVFDRGISKPKAYSKKQIEVVLNKIELNEIHITDAFNNVELSKSEEPYGIVMNDMNSKISSEFKPNIIMVQLESFFDVNHLLDYSFSENPIPNFTQLKEKYTSGFLTVPSYGAGTVNTEFEILTGMKTDYFGSGELPYRTILRSTTCESICYDLTELGYHNYVIHNNTGTFYDRKDVFPKLGFDNFSSIEYMNNLEYNPTGWANDSLLTNEILKALKAGDTRDFIYTITVQAHGKYPVEMIEANQKIKVVVDPYKRIRLNTEMGAGTSKYNSRNVHMDDSYKNQFEYYVNQLAETDKFIGELTRELSGYKEPTVIVLYGDHLPPLSFEAKDLVNNNKFQTEYVLWSNFPMHKEKHDLYAYQLNAYLMERLGYENGVLTKFHQRCISNADYQKELKLLQYDMLYGNRYIYGGESPYIEKAMKMGISEVSITKIIEIGEDLYILGKNFTAWSVAFIDEEEKETTFIDENTLIVPNEKLLDKSILVAQVTNKNVILSKSNEYQTQ
ncbi:MAG: Arylsulfatase [Herbinix sp.]|jgi:phosphoglycerol transferase MdoB-like AlkP superfamily enzyme|nr:Arylsulfatase [Herbinix sp.]